MAFQKIEIRVRKKGTANPLVRAEIWETGGAAPIVNAIDDTEVISTTGAVLTGNFDADLLSDPTGSKVEVRVIGTGAAGGALEIGAGPYWAAALESGAAHAKAPVDTAGISDSIVVSQVAHRTRAPVDRANIGDAITRSGAKLRAPVDRANLNDVVARGATKLRTPIDAVGVADSVSRVAARLRAVADSICALDAMIQGGVFHRTATPVDRIGASDTAQIDHVIGVVDNLRAPVDKVSTRESTLLKLTGAPTPPRSVNGRIEVSMRDPYVRSLDGRIQVDASAPYARISTEGNLELLPSVYV